MDGALSVDALSPKLSGIGRYCWELANRLPLNPQIAGVDYFQGSQWFDDTGSLLSGGHAPLRHRNPGKRAANAGGRTTGSGTGEVIPQTNFFPCGPNRGRPPTNNGRV